MNIEQFRARVAESAAAAHKAARHLSSLDEMAENDEYIQSPDLNVSTKTKKGIMGHESSSSSFSNDANSSSEIPTVVEDLSTRFVDVISMAARSPSRPPLVASRTQSPTLELTAKKTEIQATKSALIPSVAAVYEQNHSKKAPLQPKQKTEQSQLSHTQNSKAPKATGVNEKHALILQQLDYDSDSDSSDGEQSIDSNSQPHNALHEELEYEVNESIVSQESSSNLEKKDPNRFMTMTADLESEREALIANDTSISSTTVLSHKDNTDGRGGLWGNNNALRGGTAGEETNKALKAGLSWVQKVATPQLNAISQHILTKVADSSRTDNSQSSSGSVPMIPSRSKEPQYKESDEENITMTTSSAFLSADEIAEFEQMQSKSSQSAIVAMVLPLVEAIKGNQRMAFVAVTLILSIFVYYYSRKRSVDDVL
eukprot:scaffold5363_cov113-Skeletonema_dohrnii-CCMP3373.AAC.7